MGETGVEYIELTQCKIKISMLCWDATSMHRYLGPLYPNESAFIWVTWPSFVYSCCIGYRNEYPVCLLMQESLMICDIAATNQNQDHILKLENHLCHIHYGLYSITGRS